MANNIKMYEKTTAMYPTLQVTPKQGKNPKQITSVKILGYYSNGKVYMAEKSTSALSSYADWHEFYKHILDTLEDETSTANTSMASSKVEHAHGKTENQRKQHEQEQVRTYVKKDNYKTELSNGMAILSEYIHGNMTEKQVSEKINRIATEKRKNEYYLKNDLNTILDETTEDYGMFVDVYNSFSKEDIRNITSKPFDKRSYYINGKLVAYNTLKTITKFWLEQNKPNADIETETPKLIKKYIRLRTLQAMK